jgi:hypothetical protein
VIFAGKNWHGFNVCVTGQKLFNLILKGGPKASDNVIRMGDSTVARELWERAVALGAVGAVARAKSILDDADAVVGSSQNPLGQAVRSLGQSTRASWLRQSGRHAAAQGPDGRAALIATRSCPAPSDGEWVRAALGDALIGLAADNLGLGRFDASSRLLVRAGEVLGLPGEGPVGDWIVAGRVALRWHWVSAENALYRGDAAAGQKRAQEAQRLAADCPSVHHRIKTRLIVAAATAASGDLDASQDLARTVVDDAEKAGLTPLRWAGWQLLAGIAPSEQEHRQIEETTALLRATGFFPGSGFVADAPDV